MFLSRVTIYNLDIIKLNLAIKYYSICQHQSGREIYQMRRRTCDRQDSKTPSESAVELPNPPYVVVPIRCR